MNKENIVLCGAVVEQALIHSTLSSIFLFTFTNRSNRRNRNLYNKHWYLDLLIISLSLVQTAIPKANLNFRKERFIL
ncbi:hypothetical protein [Bacillus paramobilis]|uniref:hypothetical protein n=1 Tax=Bacillus paramobilis TaxID=2817477 RepID=UPI0005393286